MKTNLENDNVPARHCIGAQAQC
ncbi:hypothetical protein PUN4_540022 [Paraburkholderia unamae]|nr:hypothetical protein PUN4_540022 [Paraburkholderia unamae]